MFTTLERRLGDWVLRWRWPILLLGVLLIALLGSGAAQLRISNDYRVFFDADDPQLLAYEAMQTAFSRSDNLLIVVSPRDGEVFSPATLTALDWLSTQAWQLPYSSRVDSLTNFQHSAAQGDELLIGDLVPDPQAVDAAGLERLRAIALAEPRLRGRLLSADAAVTGINITLQLPRDDATQAVAEVSAAARELLARAAQRYPQLDLRLTGVVMMNQAFQEASMADLRGLVPLSFLVMLAGLALLLRGLSAALGVLLVILGAVITALGLGGHLGLPISPPSATAPTVILTVAIANSVHLLLGYRHELREGQPRDQALRRTLASNLMPITLASVTTAVGFLSLNLSAVPPLRDLGNLVAAGVLSACLLSLTLLPALMSLLPPLAHPAHHRGPGQGRQDDRLLLALAGQVLGRRRSMLLLLGLLCLVLLAGLPRIELNDVLPEYFSPDTPFRADTDYTRERLTGLDAIEFGLDAGAPGAIAEPEFLAEIEAFTTWLRAQPEVVHVSSLSDTLKRLNRNLHGDAAQAYQLPASRELAAQYLLLYELSLPYGLDLTNEVNQDKSQLRLIATLGDVSSRQMLDLEDRAAAWLAQQAPHVVTAQASGPSLMFAHISADNVRAMLSGSFLALVLISILLSLALGSLRLGAISLLPNLAPIAMGFGIWGYAVGEVGLALSVVASMALGIVVDDSVHFLSKYQRARRESGLDAAAALRRAYSQVGRALIVTSVVLIAGFLVLSASDFHINAGMGLLTAIVIALALAADLLLLPPLLLTIEGPADDPDTPARPLAGDPAAPPPAGPR